MLIGLRHWVPNVNGLEEDLENYLGNQSFVGALSSGTAAIHLGLILLGVKADDEVICQSMTFRLRLILFFI
jgi:dTDP-4-amino-4,6-dideoxygalactose transaminase